MTEHEWQTSADAYAMLDYRFPMAGFHSTPEQPRKLRLYYVALARQRAAEVPAAAVACLAFAEDLADEVPEAVRRWYSVAEVVERLAVSGGPDCRATVAECEHRLRELGLEWPADSPSVPPRWSDPDRSFTLGWLLLMPLQTRVPSARQLRRAEHDTDLLRDLFGSTFEVPVLDPAWRSDPVVGIAEKCYTDRDFHALPVLADALQDVGCPGDHPVVRHCREEPPHTHARGCWAVDLVLLRRGR